MFTMIAAAPLPGAAAGLRVGVVGFPPAVLLPGFSDPPVPEAEAAGNLEVADVVADEALMVMESGTPSSLHNFSVKANVFWNFSGEQADSTTGRSEVRKPWFWQMHAISVRGQPVEVKDARARVEAQEGTSLRDCAEVVRARAIRGRKVEGGDGFIFGNGFLRSWSGPLLIVSVLGRCRYKQRFEFREKEIYGGKIRSA